uniref:Protein ZNF783-like isoform X3 n=1 Tax=Geotrypetes seraphini TaxID=260995 RepID=A0A6P8R347_GEOSA|nr:protein ZNF783-like isoform X3 [Geotrypetes seraphini]
MLSVSVQERRPEPPARVQTLLAFEDVAVYFSEEEWALLDELQKDIYKNTMRENYETLLSLGLTNMKPEIIAKIDAGEAPSVRNGSYLEKQGRKNAAGRGSVTIVPHKAPALPILRILLVPSHLSAHKTCSNNETDSN